MKLPNLFIEKYKRLLGEESSSFFKALDDKPVQSFRLNTLKISSKMKDSLLLDERIPWCNEGYYGKISGHTPAIQSGSVYSQEASAMLVGEVADVRPGERVLDLCGAPGGKSTHLATQLGGQGLLVSNEINFKRAQILSENIERAGIQNAVVTNHQPSELVPFFSNFFDCIVVDAPCSGEGMMRKDGKAIEQWTPSLVEQCATRQWKIVQNAYQMLSPGGRMVYSTCTFAPEENEQIIARLLTDYPDLHIIPLKKIGGLTGGHPEWADGNSDLCRTLRAWPHHLRGEGHFVALLKKEGESGDPSLKEATYSVLTEEQTKYLSEFMSQSLTQSLPNRLYMRENHVSILPDICPSLTGLTHLRAGLHVGQWKKKRFEPSHALALSLPLDYFQRTYPLSPEEYVKYMVGETFNVDQADGWCVVTVNDNALGWVKVVKGVAKNFFPKGLRFRPHLAPQGKSQ